MAGGGRAKCRLLTRFCATLIRTLRARPEHYIPLVFFCGSHVERDDPYHGGRAMVRSSITQLLRYGTAGSVPVHVDFDGALRRGTGAERW